MSKYVLYKIDADLFSIYECSLQNILSSIKKSVLISNNSMDNLIDNYLRMNTKNIYQNYKKILFTTYLEKIFIKINYDTYIVYKDNIPLNIARNNNYILYKINNEMFVNIDIINKNNKNIDSLIYDFIKKYKNNSIENSNYFIIKVSDKSIEYNANINNSNIVNLMHIFLDKYKNEIFKKNKNIKLYIDKNKNNIFCIFDNKLFITDNTGSYIIYKDGTPLIIKKNNKKSKSICNLLKIIN